MEKEKINDVSLLLKYLPEVRIDKGTFKYIVIEVSKKKEYLEPGQIKKSVNFIRGYLYCEYHANILDDFTLRELGNLKVLFTDNIKGKEVTDSLEKVLSVKVLGGGRIEHVAEKKKIYVYGFSQGYGPANHEKTLEILKKYYVDYTDMTWSNDGY
jgi:phosphohistidine phosphatase